VVAGKGAQLKELIAAGKRCIKLAVFWTRRWRWPDP
jgi:hypothetical protein